MFRLRKKYFKMLYFEPKLFKEWRKINKKTDLRKKDIKIKTDKVFEK